MECIPAIDVRAGVAVRLVQGDFSRETGYGDPVALARRYAEAGATRLHVVDLDAARGEGASNRAVVEAVVASVGIEVQLGGGIRSEQVAQTYLDLGVARLVLGTAGIRDPDLLERLCRAHPGRVLLGLDHRRTTRDGAVRRELAVQGWVARETEELFSVLSRVEEIGLAGVVVTDITRDGTLAGPDLAGYAEILASTKTPVIASGGVARLEDLTELRALCANGRRLAGVVVGKALASGAFGVGEAIAACAR